MLKRSENNPFYANGLRFSCKRCSRCCRYDSGYVFLSENDALRMAAALKMSNKEFTAAFCRWISIGNGQAQLSLKEKSNYDCILWSLNAGDSSEGGCSVYNERPLQCRAFPFWQSMLASEESWETASLECPGMGKGSLYSRDSINDWLSMQENEPIMLRKV